MNLNENINRILTLINESDGYSFETSGDFNDILGLKLKLNNKEDNIGHIKGYRINRGLNLDPALIGIESPDMIKPNDLNNETAIFLVDLIIKDNFRNNGYGKKLLKKMLDNVKNNGYKYIVGVVDDNNSIAQNMYEKMNWKVGLYDKPNKAKIYFCEL